jgi:hypothetical protein
MIAGTSSIHPVFAWLFFFYCKWLIKVCRTRI